MGTIELFNLIFSNVFGALITLWKNKQEDKKSEREFFINTIKEQGKQNKEVREYQGVPVTEQNRIRTNTKKITFWNKVFAWESSSNDSGKYRSSTGFHITRRIIAILCVISIIVLPIILPVFFDASVTFGYIENAKSIFFFWSDETPIIKWITIGNAEKNIVITPVMSNIIIHIIGLFFGNQFCKRN